MSRAWDTGVCHETWALPFASAPAEPLSVDFVREQHLRLSSAVEDDYIEHLITSARQQAERHCWRPLVVTTYRMVLDRFPSAEIVLRYPPLIEVTSLSYVDTDGDTQTLVEDTDFYVVRPDGPTAGRAKILPSVTTIWPATQSAANAVTIDFEAGYLDGTSPAALNVPQDVKDGMLLWIAERYKQRSLSVHAFNQTPAVLQAESIWKRYRAY